MKPGSAKSGQSGSGLCQEVWNPPIDLLVILPLVGYGAMTRAFLTQWAFRWQGHLMLAIVMALMNALYAWIVVSLAATTSAATEAAEDARPENKRLNFFAVHFITIIVAIGAAAGFSSAYGPMQDSGLFSHPAVVIGFILLFPGIVSGFLLGYARIRRLRDVAEALIVPTVLNTLRVVLHRNRIQFADWGLELYMTVGIFPSAIAASLLGWGAMRYKSVAVRLAAVIAVVLAIDGAFLLRLPDLHPDYAHPELQAKSLVKIGRLRAHWLGKRLSRALDSSDPAVRHGALILLAADSFAGKEAEDKISKIIVDGDEQEFSVALQALPRFSGDYPYAGLRNYADHGSDAERLRVARAAGFIKSNGWTDTSPEACMLLKLLDDPNPQIRREAALSIKEHGISAFHAVPDLLRRAADPDADARAAAREAFIVVTDTDAMNELGDWWQWQSGDHSTELRRRIAAYPAEATAGLAIRIFRLGSAEILPDLKPILVSVLKTSEKRTGPIVWAERAAQVEEYKKMHWDILSNQEGRIQYAYRDGIREALRLLGARP